MSIDQPAQPAVPIEKPGWNGRGVPPERAELLNRIRRSATTPGGRLLLIGDPGVGKSMLMERVLQEIIADGLTVLQTRTSQAQTSRPFHGLIDLLAPIGPEAFDRLPAVQREAVEVALARRSVGRELPPMALPAAVAGLIAGLAEAGQVVIAIDDVNWLDAETAALVQYVLTRPGPQAGSTSLVATQRLHQIPTVATEPDPVAPLLGHPSFAPAEIVTVTGVGIDALAMILTDTLGRSLSPTVLAAIHRQSDGNPLWATELALAQAAQTNPGAELPLPASIASAVRDGVRSVPDPAREVLSIVAAMGSAPMSAVLTLMKRDQDPVIAALDLRIVREVGGRLHPGHPLIGQAALDLLGPGRRLALHRRLTEVAGSTVERAYHADRGALAGPDESVAAALCEAAAETRARGALVSARAQAERALLRTTPTSPLLDRRHVVVAELAFALGDYDRAIEVLEPVDLATVDLCLLDRLLVPLLDAILVGRGEEALRQELELRSEQLSGSPLRSAMIIANQAADLGFYPPDERITRAAQALATLQPHPAVRVSVHRALSALVLAKVDAGDGFDYELLARTAAVEPELPSLSIADSAEAEMGYYGYVTGDLTGSRTALEALIQRSADSGDAMMLELFRAHLATVEMLAGRTEVAARLIGQIDSEPWKPSVLPSPLKARGLVLIGRDDRSGLETLLSSPHTLGSETRGRLHRLALRGIQAARTENWAEAVPLLTEAREMCETRGAREPGRRMWLDVELTESLIALNRLDEGADALTRIFQVSQRRDCPLLRGLHLRLQATLSAAQGDLPEAEDLLVASAASLARTDFRLEQARTQFELGRVLRRRRARQRSRDVLDGALALADEIDDQPLRTRIRRTLTGSTTSRTDDGLSAAEARIAAGVASGLSNKELAAAQYVSVRTVEAHLTSIYRKLGVRSRSQLAIQVRTTEALSDPPSSGT